MAATSDNGLEQGWVPPYPIVGIKPNAHSGHIIGSKRVPLYEPITLRGLTLKNRIAIAPMCQYSSRDGFANDWHLRHLGSYAVGGAALVMVEATATEAIGRISPFDVGLWKDEHIAPLKRIATFLRSHGAASAIQLAHAGRKASTSPPFIPPREGVVGPELGGWPSEVEGPSAVPFAANYPMPKAMTRDDIKRVIASFVSSTRRAEQAGFDVVEIHAAHGYLISSFLSSTSNRRTDEYGGSLQNRMRFGLEVTAAVRAVWPAHKPLFVRFSCHEWVEGGWDMKDSLVFAEELKKLKVDLIDCSSGGNDARQAAMLRTALRPLYQVPFAAEIKSKVGIVTGAVGLITTAKEANDIVADGKADVVFLARHVLREPFFGITAARDLGVEISVVPQYQRAVLPMPKAAAAAPVTKSKL